MAGPRSRYELEGVVKQVTVGSDRIEIVYYRKKLLQVVCPEPHLEARIDESASRYVASGRTSLPLGGRQSSLLGVGQAKGVNLACLLQSC